MTTTRTGQFPIGIRRGWSEWQKNLPALIAWAKDHDFAAIDVGPIPEAEVKSILDAGLKVGSVDVPRPWEDLGAADPAKRKDAAQRCASYINALAELGVRNFFAVMFPENNDTPRAQSLDLLADGYTQLCAAIEPAGARVVLEGYPGGTMHFAAFGCTPADLRLLFERIPSKALGINYDPSHLIRMGIDHIRFVEEFAPRIYHVHGKDTELLPEGLYDHGHLQNATLAKPHGFGGQAWRYTLPGHGVARWTRLLSVLKANRYDGLIGIELEDEHFNGSEAGEKLGYLASRDFLMYA